MSSISVPTADIIHGPVTHAAPQLYGRPPKSGSQADSLSFHLVYDDVSVPMRDGVELIGDLYIPSVNNTLDTSRQWPCVLIRTPYNKDKINPDLRNPGVYWTQNGYCLPPHTTHTHIHDSAALLAVVSLNKDCDGMVGLCGGRDGIAVGRLFHSGLSWSLQKQWYVLQVHG